MSLLVAWRSIDKVKSAGAMPSPSSLTRISALPAFSMEIKISRAPASSEFSIRQQQLQQAGGGRLAHRHRAGDADHERHPAAGLRGTRRWPGAAAACPHVEVEQPGERQVDVAGLLRRQERG